MSRLAMRYRNFMVACVLHIEQFAGRHVLRKGSLHAAGGMLDISRAMAFAPQRPQAAGAASPAEVNSPYRPAGHTILSIAGYSACRCAAARQTFVASTLRSKIASGCTMREHLAPRLGLRHTLPLQICIGVRYTADAVGCSR